MRLVKKILIVTILIAGFIATSPLSSAKLIDSNADSLKDNSEFAKSAGYNTEGTDLQLNLVIGKIIQIVLGFLGIIFVILIIFSGYQWMTAGGNSDTIKKARDRMINAVIGLVIVLAAYSITWFVMGVVLEKTGVIPPTP